MARRKRKRKGAGGVQSADVAATILKTLAAQGGVLALKELARAAGMPRAKVHRYLASLRRSGVVAQDAESGRYRLGEAAVAIGLVGLRLLNPVRQLSAALPGLRERINETVTAAIWSDAGPMVIAIEESDRLVTMNVRVGSVLPVSTTAIGRVFAAHLPGGTTRRFIAAERRRGGAPDAKALARLLHGIRARGLSFRRGALIPNVDAIAAPVFDHRGKLVGVICVVGRAQPSMARGGRLAHALATAAQNLSRQLGHSAEG